MAVDRGVNDVAPHRVIHHEATDEHADVTPGDRPAEPGVVECLPRHLQQQPLLRIHDGGLARGDAEEVGVEPHSDWARNPPCRVYILPGASGSGS